MNHGTSSGAADWASKAIPIPPHHPCVYLYPRHCRDKIRSSRFNIRHLASSSLTVMLHPCHLFELERHTRRSVLFRRRYLFVDGLLPAQVYLALVHFPASSFSSHVRSIHMYLHTYIPMYIFVIFPLYFCLQQARHGHWPQVT